MSAELIINSNPFETRVALVENAQVAELYVERSSDRGIAGNIYKGMVVRVLPGMQAAFVDIGLDRAAFLYVSDIYRPIGEMEQFFISGCEQEREETSSKEAIENAVCEYGEPEFRSAYDGVPIEDRLQEGQDILVQVAKEPIGSKGARITTHITLPGRNLVFMPTMDRVGVSRRIEDEIERKRLRELMCEIKPPRQGFIVRTVAEGAERRSSRRSRSLWPNFGRRFSAGPKMLLSLL